MLQTECPKRNNHPRRIAPHNPGNRAADAVADIAADADTIRAETLAGELVLAEAAGEHRETARLEGHDIGIGIAVTGTIFSGTSG